MFNYRLNDPLNARMYFDDAPIGVLNSPQIHRPQRGTIGRYVNILLDEWFKKILGAGERGADDGPGELHLPGDDELQAGL